MDDATEKGSQLDILTSVAGDTCHEAFQAVRDAVKRSREMKDRILSGLGDQQDKVATVIIDVAVMPNLHNAEHALRLINDQLNEEQRTSVVNVLSSLLFIIKKPVNHSMTQ